MESYFFLSYARADDDGGAIGCFYQDLRAELAQLDPEAERLPAFLDVEQILLGADWERRLSRAINHCRVLVALYSPAYFASLYCGKEWTAFHRRTTAYQQDTGWDPGALVPVLWEPVPGGPPEPVARVQYLEPAMGGRYAELGLRHLLREARGGAEYRTVVEVLARRIGRAAGRVRLPPLPDLDLREVAGVFPPDPPAERHSTRPVTPGHLFVSYAPADRMRAEWVAGALTALGYSSSLHSLSGPPAGAGSPELDWALAGRGRVVALLSADYLRHPRAEPLWRALAGREVVPGLATLVPLRVGELDGPLPRLYAERPVTVLAGAAAPGDQLAAAVGRPADTAPPAAAPPRPPDCRPAVERLPARNASFTGRAEELESLREGFTGAGRTVQVITGLGGVGKSQTAAEYAHRFRAGYDLVWWIAAGHVEYLAPQLAALAERLGLGVGADSADTAAQVLRALQRGEPYARWLLVLDNAGPPEQLGRWLVDGPSGGHLLLTSRDPGWSRHAAVLELGAFHRDESLRLLHQHNPTLSGRSAERVADQLGDLPLAVAQAAAWLQESGMPAADYLDLLSTTLTDILEHTRLPAADYPRSVAATWLLSLEELRRSNARAAELLEVCAHFGPEPIPTALLFSPPLLRHLGLGRPTPAARLALGALVRTIHRTGLARADGGRESLTLHRLVQAVVRDQATDERRAAQRRTAQLCLAAVAPQDPDQADAWPAFAELLPHLWPSGAPDSTEPEVRRLLVNTVRYLWKTGLAREGRELAERTLDHWAAADGEPQPELHTGMLRVQLANVLRDQGEFRRSYTLDSNTYERFRRELGPGDLQTLIAASNLAADLRMLGRFAEARKLDRASLLAAEQGLGPHHPRVAMITHNVALSEALAGNWRQALTLHRLSYRRQRQALGPHDQRTLVAAAAYGLTLRKTGRPREAAALLTEVLQTYRTTVSARHPGLLFALVELAATEFRLARLDDAREHAEAGYRAFLELLGLRSIDTLSAADTLATVLQARGDTGAALQLSRRAHDTAGQQLGGDHPLTLGLSGNLARHLRAAGDVVGAGTLTDAAVAGLSRALGPEHCYLGPVLLNQATTVAERGSVERAVAIGRRAEALLLGAFGPTHHDVLAARANLAVDLGTLGERDEAAGLSATAARDADSALGADHPLTRAVRSGERVAVPVESCDL
ncbi:FxSxx-COOH system tetratricopeptide repeat protein [Kitasatospora sp. NPDC058965]|uniref:FxSxx-COOH system tetratricopeptide repeat protein n=1 Tax=Kitasatospora sp. NPDC058965 TaxID=3346682 RepID=UPI0036D01EBB